METQVPDLQVSLKNNPEIQEDDNWDNDFEICNADFTRLRSSLSI